MNAWKVGVLLLAGLAGCSDLSQRFGGVRQTPETTVAEGPFLPAQPLRIPNAPSVAHADFNSSDDSVKQAKFVPKRDPEPAPPVAMDPQLLDHPLRFLYERAAQRLAGMDSYIFRMKRRETVNGKKQPEEVVQVKLRREPYSVYLKWLNPECKGRETVYVRGKYDDKMQLVLAANDAFPFSPAGMRWSIAPDDPMARARSRYPITETGFAAMVDRFGKMVAAVEKGDTREGTAKFIPHLKRPQFPAQLDAVLQVMQPGNDPHFPKGGERLWCFDPATGLPALVVAKDATGEVEYYCYDHIQTVRLDEDDFNPDRLWRK